MPVLEAIGCPHAVASRMDGDRSPEASMLGFSDGWSKGWRLMKNPSGQNQQPHVQAVSLHIPLRLRIKRPHGMPKGKRFHHTSKQSPNRLQCADPAPSFPT
jgi:hypothetical protein